MKLKKLIVKNYRSIKQEETLLVDDRVTILIGANDHGKSNLLAALQCLNDDKKIDPDDKNWDSPDSSSVEIKWHFLALDETLEKLRQLGPKLEPAPVDKEQPKEQPKETPHTPTAEQPEQASPVQEGQSPPAQPEVPPPTFPISENNEIIFLRDSSTNIVKVAALPLPVLVSNEQSILSMRPRVELFESPSGNVVDQINLQQLEEPKFEFMQGIFHLAGLWDVKKEIFTQNNTTSKLLDAASTTLTNLLNDRWNQGKELKWKFKHTGNNGDQIMLEIEDPAISGRYTRPSLRSSGFRTYFLLSMIIYARTKNTPNYSNILLFDEPGTYLHPAAQLDLQRSFEVIADEAQIVYTTHSLFLVSKNYPQRNRVVSKTAAGTKIDQKPFSRNWKSVRESLGILLSNNFLIADKTLLVEGPSDIIYFLDAVRKLKSLGSLDIDLNDISIVDAGDAQNYVAMAKIMLSEGRNIVALLDGDSGGKKLQAQLEKSCAAELDTKKLQIHILPDNKSSEDIFANLDILKNATRKAYDKLISDDIRVAKTGLNMDDEINKIATTTGSTLGKTLEKITKPWFDPAEKISKLLIAILYEDLREDNTAPLPTEAAIETNKIKNLLNLRGEKSKETGVFAEVQ